LIRAAAHRQHLDPELVLAVTAAESAFDPGAISPKGARGLMQIMPATARRFGIDPEDLLQPAANVRAGTRYLHWLSEHYDGELPLMLAAYNAGERAVANYGGVPPYPETRQYLRRIYRRLGKSTAEITAYERKNHAGASSGRP
jgi:soluble lytic murein transglycosylase-like protein